MCTLPIPTGKSLAYVSAIHSIYLFKKFGPFANIGIWYAKTIMCTLPITTGVSLANVSAILSIFMVKIVIGGLR